MNRLIEIKNLSKEFTDSAGFTRQLFSELSFSVTDGITTILAPTGSGKSSLLKIIAGLQNPTSGQVISEAGDMIFLPSQNLIFPWLNVRDNITYNLENFTDADLKNVIEYAGLDGYEDHIPQAVNSGFVLRVALARSIIRKPDLILVDESFDDIKPEAFISALQLIRNIWEIKRIPFLIGSSNISTALFLSDKIYLMQKKPGIIHYETEVVFNSKRDANLFAENEFKEKKQQIESKINAFNESYKHEFIL